MNKVWQWIRDKKTNTIRKWRSTVFGGGGTTFEGGGTRYYSELDVPESRLKPIGGSDNALARSQTEKLFRKQTRTPTIKKKPRSESTHSNGQLEPLLMRESISEDESESREYFDCTTTTNNENNYQNYDDLYGFSDEYDDSPRPSTSFSISNNNPGMINDDIYDVFDEEFVVNTNQRKLSSASISRFTNSGSVSPDPASLPRTEIKLVPALRRPSNDNNLDPSPVVSPKAKRKLRFNIPQISLSTSDEPNASATILIQGSPPTSEFFYDEFQQHQMGAEGSGSSTALAVGMAAAATAAFNHSAASAAAAAASSAPVTPVIIKTPDFENENKQLESPQTPIQQHPPRRSTTDIDRRRQSLAQRRQSNVQLVQSVSGRRTSTTLIPLTLAQIHLIRSLWRQIYLSKGPTVIGQTIIHRLFFKMPKVKDQFRRCPLPRSFPNHDSFAKAHSKAMADLVDHVVENLDNLEAISPELERVGRVHAQIMRGELSSKLWNTVAETFIDCTLEWGDKRCRSETVRKAWALIIAFMVERIKTGHLEQRKHMLTMRSTIAALERTELKNAAATVASKQATT